MRIVWVNLLVELTVDHFSSSLLDRAHAKLTHPAEPFKGANGVPGLLVLTAI